MILENVDVDDDEITDDFLSIIALRVTEYSISVNLYCYRPIILG